MAYRLTNTSVRTVREIIPSIAGTVETVCRELIATGKPRLNVEMIGETGGATRCSREHG